MTRKPTRAERKEAVRILLRRGWAPKDIPAYIGISLDTYKLYRAELGGDLAA